MEICEMNEDEDADMPGNPHGTEGASIVATWHSIGICPVHCRKSGRCFRADLNYSHASVGGQAPGINSTGGENFNQSQLAKIRCNGLLWPSSLVGTHAGRAGWLGCSPWLSGRVTSGRIQDTLATISTDHGSCSACESTTLAAFGCNGCTSEV